MQGFPDKSVDCIITDPPYGINGAGFVWKEKSYKRIDAKWDKQEPDYIWIDECIRLIKDGGAIYITGTQHNIFNVKNYLDSRGMNFNNFIVWHKPNGMPIKYAKQLGIFAFSCEYILYYSKGKPLNFQYNSLKAQNNGKQQRDFIILNTCEDLKSGHPSQKPLKLMRKFIIASSKEGDIILDPFAGSGTTCVACKQLNRKYIGIEKEEEYIIMAERRLKQSILSNMFTAEPKFIYDEKIQEEWEDKNHICEWEFPEAGKGGWKLEGHNCPTELKGQLKILGDFS